MQTNLSKTAALALRRRVGGWVFGPSVNGGPSNYAHTDDEGEAVDLLAPSFGRDAATRIVRHPRLSADRAPVIDTAVAHRLAAAR